MRKRRSERKKSGGQQWGLQVVMKRRNCRKPYKHWVCGLYTKLLELQENLGEGGGSTEIYGGNEVRKRRWMWRMTEECPEIRGRWWSAVTKNVVFYTLMRGAWLAFIREEAVI